MANHALQGPSLREAPMAFTLSQPVGFEPILSAEEAARLLGKHPKTLQRWARNGTLPSYRIGNQWHFRVSELNLWLSSSHKIRAANVSA